MDSGQNLHDFVLNLLSDPDARTAFELDPEGALHDAGLNDITAVDVQDVIPLVIDYAPVNGLADLDSDQLGLSALDAGPSGAVQQLQLVTQQLPLLGGPSAAEVNAAAAGTITAGSGGLTSWTSASIAPDQVGVSVGAESLGPDAFAASQDLTVSLDAPALDHSAVDLGAAEVTSDGTVDVSGTGGVDLGDPLGGLTGTLDGVTGTLGVSGTLDSVTGTLGGVTGTVDGVTGGLTGDVHGLTGGLTDGLGVDLGHPTSSPALAPVEHTVDGTVSDVTGTLGSTGAGNLLGGVTGTVDDTTQHLPAGGVVGDVTDLLF
jgi:hypothetical protein